MTHVLFAADLRLHRDGIVELMRRDGRMQVSAVSPSTDDMATALRGVDVLVIDVASERGLASASRAARAVEIPVVALGVGAGDEDALVRLAERGVVGFVEREADVDDLVAAVEAAVHGEAWCPPSIAATLLQQLTALLQRQITSPDPTNLTARERQIVDLIGLGLSNKEIAQRLSIEVATVKNHVHNILEKLHVRRRGEAVAQLRLASSAAPAGDVVAGPGSRGALE